MTITSFADDSLIIDFPVTFPTTGPVTALGGAASVSADLLTGGTAIPAATSMAGSTVTATWAAGALAVGVYRVQLKLTISGQVQTVAEVKLRVLESNA